MEDIRVLSCIVAGFLVCSCANDRLSTDNDSNAISVAATVNSLEDEAATRSAATAVPYTQTEPSQLNPILADIWFSTTEHTFPGTGGIQEVTSKVDVHRTITYSSNNYTFPDIVGDKLLQYPANGARVYCIGFSPRGKWPTVNGTSVTSVAGLVDGVTDIMYAPEISGTCNNKLAKQQFHHALTWIKVRIRTQTNDASVTWGKLKKITIKSMDQAVYNIGTNTMTFQNSGDAPADIIAYDDAEGMDLPSVSQEIGSVFVAPVSGTTQNKATLQFIIDTEEWTGKQVTVELMDNSGSYNIGNTAGKQYVVTLSFNALHTIEASSVLTPWIDDVRELAGTEITPNAN